MKRPKYIDMPRIQITKAGEFGHGELCFACPQCMSNDVCLVDSSTETVEVKWSGGALEKEILTESYKCPSCNAEFKASKGHFKLLKPWAMLIYLALVFGLLFFGLLAMIFGGNAFMYISVTCGIVLAWVAMFKAAP